jgi:hypothetical protein
MMTNATSVSDDAFLRRVSAEYDEMPGLHLTVQQAARLFGASDQRCAAVLDELVARRVLGRTRHGTYSRLSGTALKHTA